MAKQLIAKAALDPQFRQGGLALSGGLVVNIAVNILPE